jgi:flagellar L-ring protein precursor FlgH
MSPRTAIAVLACALAGLAPPLAARAQEAAAAPPVRTISSWTSDRPLLRVGDIVTILIDEYTLALANRDELHAQSRNRDVAVGARLPGGEGGATSIGGSLGTVNDVEDRRYGNSSRRQRFQAEISARVTEMDGGIVRLEGTKKVTIDDHEQEVTIRGWVRPNDVATNNTVESWRLADAEIAYDSNGKLGSAGGFWSKLLRLIIP